jgi:hypothetical protein
MSPTMKARTQYLMLKYSSNFQQSPKTSQEHTTSRRNPRLEKK